MSEINKNKLYTKEESTTKIGKVDKVIKRYYRMLLLAY